MDYRNYADFVARLRTRLEFSSGRPANFQLHHVIPKEILNPILFPDRTYTQQQVRAARLVALAMLNDDPATGFQFNNPNHNGQFLPSSSQISSALNLTRHNGSHDAYTRAVTWMLTSHIETNGGALGALRCSIGARTRVTSTSPLPAICPA